MTRNQIDLNAFGRGVEPDRARDFPGADERARELRRLAAVLRFAAALLNRVADALCADVSSIDAAGRPVQRRAPRPAGRVS